MDELVDEIKGKAELIPVPLPDPGGNPLVAQEQHQKHVQLNAQILQQNYLPGISLESVHDEIHERQEHRHGYRRPGQNMLPRPGGVVHLVNAQVEENKGNRLQKYRGVAGPIACARGVGSRSDDKDMLGHHHQEGKG
ncbi:hypothetical protein D3C75_714320 [compost metagenome]